MNRQINHLITGAELAIENGPTIDTSNPNSYHKLFAEDFRAKMKQVLRHYQMGGQMKDRP